MKSADPHAENPICIRFASSIGKEWDFIFLFASQMPWTTLSFMMPSYNTGAEFLFISNDICSRHSRAKYEPKMHFFRVGLGIAVGMEGVAWLHLNKCLSKGFLPSVFGYCYSVSAGFAAPQNSLEAVSAISQMEAICWQAGLGVGGVGIEGCFT